MLLGGDAISFCRLEYWKGAVWMVLFKYFFHALKEDWCVGEVAHGRSAVGAIPRLVEACELIKKPGHLR